MVQLMLLERCAMPWLQGSQLDDPSWQGGFDPTQRFAACKLECDSINKDILGGHMAPLGNRGCLDRMHGMKQQAADWIKLMSGGRQRRRMVSKEPKPDQDSTI